MDQMDWIVNKIKLNKIPDLNIDPHEAKVFL